MHNETSTGVTADIAAVRRAIIGAIGVSGVLSTQDEQIATAGANRLAKLLGQ